MTGFWVLEPVPLPVPATSGDPALLDVDLSLRPEAPPYRLRLADTAESAFEVVTAVYLIGGRELLETLLAAIARTPASTPQAAGNPPGGHVADELFRLRVLRRCEEAAGDLTLSAYGHLVSLDTVMRAVLHELLAGAQSQLTPEAYGLTGLDDEYRVVDNNDTYRRFRQDVLHLLPLRRLVTRWTFTIPTNATTAREQFTRDLENYAVPYREACRTWPVLHVQGGALMRSLDDADPAAIEQWSKAEGGTDFDTMLQEMVSDAWTECRAEQPAFLRRQYGGAAEALFAAHNTTTGAAEIHFGDRHPLMRYPVIVEAALERLGWLPGTFPHAVAESARKAADAAAHSQRATRATWNRLLTWASLGFAVLAFVPVVGQLAVAGCVAASALQSLAGIADTLETRQNWMAAGAAGDRLRLASPKATGLVVDVLQLTADIALPALGSLSVAARSAERLVSASAVRRSLDLGGMALDLAGAVIQIDADHLERELERLGLDRLEGGASRGSAE
ncbi:hypothetical protein [Streptomyces sp. NBC_01643]|uniref:hypothetical protein n=1 Tax=Streptomyces sp. NBC_01643 TaxID=2975906 RepID=UPI003866D5CE|nr:hypothetical protein OHB03_47155 [Streptomyces sp. NBC_01643]